MSMFFFHRLSRKLVMALMLTSCAGITLLVSFKGASVSCFRKDENKLLVVATTGIIGDALEQIAGDQVTVKVLMNPGVDPHTYELTVRDGGALMEADLVFYNGLGLEGAMHIVFQKMEERSDKKVYAVSDGLSSNDILVDPDFSAGRDPHIWHSVVLWKKAVLYMSRQLQRKDPDHATFYEANTRAYIAKLDRLHEYILSEISKIPHRWRILVTAHDAFAYFGKTYGVSVKSLQGISTVSEPSIKDREDLANFIVSHQIRMIFAEKTVPSKGIQAVIDTCRERGYIIGVNGYLYSDSLAEKESPAGTYIGMMRANVDHIITASRSLI